MNVDETTDMFSPKVLDRANVIEFRVAKDAPVGFLKSGGQSIGEVAHASVGCAEGFLELSLRARSIKDPALVHSATIAPSKSGDSQNWVWEFQLTDGEQKGRIMKSWSSLKPQVRFRLTAFLHAFGIAAELKQFEIKVDEACGTIISPDLRGKPCIVEISNSVGDRGTLGDEVSEVLPISAGNGNPLSAAQTATSKTNGPTIGGRKLL